VSDSRKTRFFTHKPKGIWVWNVKNRLYNIHAWCLMLNLFGAWNLLLICRAKKSREKLEPRLKYVWPECCGENVRWISGPEDLLSLGDTGSRYGRTLPLTTEKIPVPFDSNTLLSKIMQVKYSSLWATLLNLWRFKIWINLLMNLCNFGDRSLFIPGIGTEEIWI
jgi:hypothetical protein